MAWKFIIAAATLVAAGLSAPHDAAAGKKTKRTDHDGYAVRDCKPINGPYGYYGNPWCDGGYKNTEDYAPGEGPFFDVFDLPRFRKYRYWD
jgi:hypothetical protein